MTVKKAFLLDRDGTINVDTGYVGTVEDVVLLPETAQAIRAINQAGYLAIVISNQSGVARGYFDTEAVDRVNGRINELLQEEDAHIDAFYYCPHLKDGSVSEYRVDCQCRKPKLGMFQSAIKDYQLDPAQCFAYGDKLRDVEALPQLGIPQAHLGVMQEGKNVAYYESLASFVHAALSIERDI